MQASLRYRLGLPVLCCILMTASAVLLILAHGHGTTESPAKTSDISSKLAVVARAFKERYSPGEAVDLLVAFGNNSKNSLFLRSRKDYSLPYVLVLTDASGRIVNKVPVSMPTPPLPPGDYYMRIDDEKVLVTPVMEVKCGAATAVILSDVLAVYPPLDPGKYTITVITGFSASEKEEVVQRPDHPHTLWARASSRDTSIRIAADPVSIEIVKP